MLSFWVPSSLRVCARTVTAPDTASFPLPVSPAIRAVVSASMLLCASASPTATAMPVPPDTAMATAALPTPA